MLLTEWKKCKKISVIYGILNVITNKWYIGSCIDLRDRIHRHYYYLVHNNHHSSKLQRSWNKYGENVFSVVILKILSEEEKVKRLDIEESFITKYNSKEEGYNMTDVCHYYNKFKLSEVAKEKAALSRRKAVIAIDRHTNIIYKKYNSITEAALDTDNQTSNISKICKGEASYLRNFTFVYEQDYDPSKDYRKKNRGKDVPKSEEWKRKARLRSGQAKKTYKYTIDGEFVEEYISRAEAERCNSFNKEGLRKHLNENINGFIYTHNKIEDIV